MSRARVRSVGLVSLAGVLLLAGASTAGAPRCAPRPQEADDHYLEACRPREVTAAEKRTVMASLPATGHVVDLTAADHEKLLGLRRVLQAHARDGVYDVRVVDVASARVGLYGRAVLLITKPALDLLSGEELQGVVAHEVGHEYLWDDWQSATQQSDGRRLREIELICDAVGALTLARIGVPPERLTAGLGRLAAYNRERFGDRVSAAAYPTPRQRGAIVASVTARLGRPQP